MRITKVLNSTKEAKITKLIKQNVIVDFDKNQEIDGFTIDFLGSLKRDEELFVSLLENDYSITNVFKAKEDEVND